MDLRVSGSKRSFLSILLLTVLVGTSFLNQSACSQPQSSSEILQELRSLRQMGTVLYVAAHPDDENTQLIAYFARGRGFRTGYLALTRGEGGQNLIGPELGDALGLIRTHELLGARRIDGGRQFFSRAKDFGFSKTVDETLAFWDHQEVLADIVRTIRSFRPDVIITRFPESSMAGMHGHHTASAVLAHEAFRLAGNPEAFPNQLDELKPWQPKRILLNWFRGPPGSSVQSAEGIHVDVGRYQPLLGESFGELAARARSQHKSQGFGSVANRGTRYEVFDLTDGDPAANDPFEGVDTTWSRLPGGVEVDRQLAGIIDRFDPVDPSASLPDLLVLRKNLSALPADPLVEDKRCQLDGIIRACLGLYVETTVPQSEVVPGENLSLHFAAIVRASVSARWTGIRYPGKTEFESMDVTLRTNEMATVDRIQAIPETTPVSVPYWLRSEGETGTYRIEDPSLIGRPLNPPVFPVEYRFDVGGQELVYRDEPIQLLRDPVEGEIRYPLEVIPPVSLAFDDDLRLFAPGSTGSVTVDATAARPGISGRIRLQAPDGWTVRPAVHEVTFTTAGEQKQVVFSVTAPSGTASVDIDAVIEVGGQPFSTGRTVIQYSHLPRQLLQQPARMKAVGLDLAIRGKNVGYLAGAGDRVAESLRHMGYVVTPLNVADLTPDRLKPFDAVVIGVRAFNTRPELAPRLPALFGYAEAGGTVVVQYNTDGGLEVSPLAPFDLSLSRSRVTDENAPVTLLAPDHPAVTTPNRITGADFEGWIQERGLYFPDQWNPAFTPILASNDPGEPSLPGGLLVARYGKGYYVYTGYSWFRQLPDGVPGAFRLFANLISLGK